MRNRLSLWILLCVFHAPILSGQTQTLGEIIQLSVSGNQTAESGVIKLSSGLKEGEEVQVSLDRPAKGDWTWVVTATSGAQRHSSFLARVDGLQRLRKMAPDYRPALSKRGESALQILEKMQAGWSNREIAEYMAEAARESFASAEEALQRVQSLALNYAKQA